MCACVYIEVSNGIYIYVYIYIYVHKVIVNLSEIYDISMIYTYIQCLCIWFQIFVDVFQAFLLIAVYDYFMGL